MLSTFKKPALVLIISSLIFVGIVYLLDFEPLDFVRTHFYNPSFVNSVVKENEKASEIVQTFFSELENKFAATLNEPAVKSSFLYNQTAADIYERSRVFGILVESISGLQAVQFVDSNGVRIHYSTSNRDIINLSNNSATYRNYTDDSRVLPYDDISVNANEKSKYTMDDAHDRIIFSFPFYDSMDVYRGTALFYLSVSAVAEKLISEGCLKPADDVSVIRDPKGVVFGSPNTSKAVILGKISSVWSAGFQEYITFDAEDSGVRYALISTKTGNNLFFGRIVNDSIFAIPSSMKFIFQFSMFLTIFLALFFLINFRPHPLTLVQNRINTLRTNLFEQLYIKKTGQDRAKWILELEQRRDEIRFELKHGLSINRKLEKEIDGIIDKAWDELLAVMKSGYDLASLEEIVKNRSVKVEKPKEADVRTKVETDDDVAEIEEIDEIEEVEEIAPEFDEKAEDDDLQDIDSIEALEEIGDIDEIEEIEEIGDEEENKPYSEIQLSKGLLKAANDILVKIRKEETKAPSATHMKGLLMHAIDYLNSKEAETEPDHMSGLLNLAIGFLNSLENKKTTDADEKAEEIEEMEEIEDEDARGLLASASAYHKPEHVAVAENFSVREIETDGQEADDNGQGLPIEMEVVSPFSSMFSSLNKTKGKKRKTTSSKRAD